MVKNLYNHLRTNPFAKNVAKLTTGSAFSKLISLITLPILSRLYLPEDYSLFALFLSISTIVSNYSTLQTEYAIPIAEDEKESFHTLSLTLIYVFLITFLSFLAFVIFSDFTLNWLGAMNLAPYKILIPIMILVSGLYKAFRYHTVRDKNFGAIMKSHMAGGGSQSGFQVLFGFLNWTTIGLLLGSLLGKFFSVWPFLKSIQNFFQNFKLFSKTDLIAAAKKFKRFPLIASWQNLFNSVGINLPIFILTKLFSDAIVGSFAFAERLVHMPMALLGTAIGHVFFAEAAEAVQKKEHWRIKPLAKSLNLKLLFMGTLPFLPLIFFGKPIITFAFGQEWADAGFYVQILAVMAIVKFCTLPISNVFNIFQKQYLSTFIDGFRIPALLAVYFYADFYKIDAKSCVMAIAATMITLNLITFVTAQSLIFHFAKVYPQQKPTS